MPRTSLHKRRLHQKKLRARARREQAALHLPQKVEETRLDHSFVLLRPELAALGDPIFPPLPLDPKDRFAAAMARAAEKVRTARMAE